MTTSTSCKSATLVSEESQESDPKYNIKKSLEFLRERTLEEVALYMKELPPLKIVVISGGRISLPLDIQDLRSTDVGLHHSPFEEQCYYSDALNKRYFLKDPAPLYKITASFLQKTYKPTYSHYFISFLEHKTLLLKNYTQNMDDLEKIAGVTRYTQLYGNFYSFVCIECGKEYSLEWSQVRLVRKKILLCTDCSSLVKPNISLYGEELPTQVYEELEADMNECKLLIVLGSTLSQEPLATVLRGIEFKYPRVFINDVDPYNFADYHFYCKHETSDVIWLGNIDGTCKKLVKLLGWYEEMQEFTKETMPEECGTAA